MGETAASQWLQEGGGPSGPASCITQEGGGGPALPLLIPVAVEVDGPRHFCSNNPLRPLGPTTARSTMLRR